MATIGNGTPMAQANTVQFIWAKREVEGVRVFFIKVGKHLASQCMRKKCARKGPELPVPMGMVSLRTSTEMTALHGA